MCTDKKENQIFLIYKEIQSGAVAKSYMRKGFLIYEEMRKYFTIYEKAISHIWLCNCSILNFLIYEENLIFFFISVEAKFWEYVDERVMARQFYDTKNINLPKEFQTNAWNANASEKNQILFEQKLFW
jgi:hypothetical protein